MTKKLSLNNEILKWARETSGYSVFQVTEFLKKRWKKTDEQTLVNWENATEVPTFNQLLFLSEKYKRPLAVFFLEKIPAEKHLPPEFRSLAEKGDIVLTPKVLLAIRKARRIQQDFALISEMLGENFDFAFEKYNFRDIKPKELADKIRKNFDYSFEKTKQNRDYAKNFNYLREKIENTNCLVLKSSRHHAFNPSDVRAFSFADSKPFLINLTNADSETGKVFSLMHEFAHVLLRHNSITSGDESTVLSKDGEIEKFCNEFASNFLVDREELIKVYKREISHGIEDTVESLAKIFKVSPFVILIALNDVNVIDGKKCSVLFENYRKKSENFSKRDSFAPNRPHKEIFGTLGEKVVNLFLYAESQEKITYANLAEYLNIPRQYLPKVFKEAFHE